MKRAYANQAISDYSYAGTGVRFENNLISFTIFDKGGNSGSWGEYVKPNMNDFDRAYKHLHRYLMGHLNLSTRAVMSEIIDRTLGFYKFKEKITIEHFMNGIQNAHSGTALGRTTIVKCTKELEELGLITKSYNYYTININNINEFLISKGKGIVMLREPKKQFEKKSGLRESKNSSHYELLGQKNSSHYEPINTTNINKIETNDSEQSSPSSGRINNFKQQMESITGSVESKPQLREPLPPKINARTVGDAWLNSIRKHHNGITTKLSPKNYGQLKIFLTKNYLPEDQLFDFFDYVAKDWDNIRKFIFSQKDRRFKDYPVLPSMDFVMACFNTYLAAYKKRFDYDARKQLESSMDYRQKLLKDKESQLTTREARLFRKERELTQKTTIDTPAIIDYNNVVDFRKPVFLDTPRKVGNPIATKSIPEGIPKTLQESAQYFQQQTKGAVSVQEFTALAENIGLESAINFYNDLVTNGML